MKLDKEKKKKIVICFISSVVCVVINFVYSLFSHGVHSNYMTFMFAVPLLLGAISILVNIHNNKLANDLAICGILTLTMGVFIKGIFEIAGTSSKYQAIYYVVGVLLYLVSFVFVFKKTRALVSRK